MIRLPATPGVAHPLDMVGDAHISALGIFGEGMTFFVGPFENIPDSQSRFLVDSKGVVIFQAVLSSLILAIVA